MSRCSIIAFILVLALGVQASWYWPFGSDDETGSSGDEPRISELIEPASLLIDEAADLASEGKIDEAVAKYRKALTELDKIEMENPDRAKKSEFATIRNKRAYVNAAIDSMLLSQVKSNARAVAVSDTTELERKLKEEREGKKEKKEAVEKKEDVEEKKVVEEKKEAEEEAEKVEKKRARRVKKAKKAKKAEKAEKAVEDTTPAGRAMKFMAEGDFAAARAIISEMLKTTPNSAAGLNLKAVVEVREGKFREAEETLDRAIMSNPRSYYAYYNMAKLLLQMDAEKKPAARRYYETGRSMGGPEDASLEARLR